MTPKPSPGLATPAAEVTLDAYMRIWRERGYNFAFTRPCWRIMTAGDTPTHLRELKRLLGWVDESYCTPGLKTPRGSAIGLNLLSLRIGARALGLPPPWP